MEVLLQQRTIVAITIDRLTSVISIPQGDLALLSGTLYAADTNAIRLSLKAIEASEEGIVFSDTHKHNTTVTLFGVTYARLIEIISPYSITFTPDAQWSARLDGSNNNYGDVAAGILNQNQVQVIPTNSAGLIDLEILTSSAYQGRVVVSPTNGQAGTAKPIGTFERPVNNMTDALVIAIREGLSEFLVTESMTVASGDFSLGYNFRGTSPSNVLTLLGAANVTKCNFTNLSLSGPVDGVNKIVDCEVLAVTGFSGVMLDCDLRGDTDVSGVSHFIRCYSGLIGGVHPKIKTIGTNEIIVRDFHGSIGLSDMTGGEHSVEVSGGEIVIEATSSGGTVNILGKPFKVQDLSGATVTQVLNIIVPLTTGEFLALK